MIIIRLKTVENTVSYKFRVKKRPEKQALFSRDSDQFVDPRQGGDNSN